MQTQQEVINSLPMHLQPFIAEQNYAAYTPRDHAIWRFLVRQLSFSLQSSAHPTYFEGLEKTGIDLNSIPRIEAINEKLGALGWRAVAVDGFLPPAVFMEFQALKVLAIAVNIRSFDHMLYTPAPDIIHESAGHAPFLIDIDYAEFLQQFGELGMQAVTNDHDMQIYEAVRLLSIVKESTSSSSQDIEEAEQRVYQLRQNAVEPSEASLLARLHWWTVEYGLVGTTSNYQIFGAGLLSSLSESNSCLDDSAVVKKPLTLQAIDTDYDITQPQPLLFVTQSCRHLSQVLSEYGRRMCCQRGGTSALLEAQQAATVCTSEFNSGLQVSGKLDKIHLDALGNAVYLNTTGPTQLAFRNNEIAEQGIRHHEHGFGSPVGRLVTMERCLSNYTVDELKRHNIEKGQPLTLNYLSGITVTGVLKDIIRAEQRNLLLTISDCTVINVHGEILFDPEWGIYDMAVGDSVVGVSGGSADPINYPIYEAPSDKVTETQCYEKSEQQMFNLYDALANANGAGNQDLDESIQKILDHDNPDWLLVFEAMEIAMQWPSYSHYVEQLKPKLKGHDKQSEELIGLGIQRLGLS